MSTQPLRQLTKENAQGLSQLKVMDQELITSIIRRLGILKINTVQAQLIKRDLIGMAMECDKRGTSFESELGDDPEKFARDVYNSNSSNLSNWKELVYKFTMRLSGLFAVWFLVNSLLLFGSFTWQAPMMIYPIYVGAALASFGFEYILEPYFVMKKGTLRHLPQVASLGLMVIAVALAARVATPIFSQHTVFALPIIVVSGMIYIVSLMGYKHALVKVL